MTMLMYSMGRRDNLDYEAMGNLNMKMNILLIQYRLEWSIRLSGTLQGVGMSV